MRRPFVKVCGITSLEDAMRAVGAGADAIGFVFVPGSPRRVDPATAAAIAARLPAAVARVGVVADLQPEAAAALVRESGLSALQAHGGESPDLCRAYPVPVVKALPSGMGFDPADLEAFRGFPILLDGGTGPGEGGSGRRADWSAAAAAVRAGFRVLLAGGLGPETVRMAVEQVVPLAVDLNSAVEHATGRKDPERLAAAIRALEDLEPPLESTWPW